MVKKRPIGIHTIFLVRSICACVGTQSVSGAVPIRSQQLDDRWVDEIANIDLSSGTTGLVVGLYHEGQLQFLEAWGKLTPEATEPLSPDALLGFPAFTEVLVAAAARALSAARVLDIRTPLGLYVPELPQGMGRVTLDQLFSHTAGLDNLATEEDDDWSLVMDTLSDRAIFTDPGLTYSPSRSSYPFAVRALEKAMDLPIREIITTVVLGPLQMERTTLDLDAARALGLAQGRRSSGTLVEAVDEVNGLPVVFTTVGDVIQFLVTMGSGLFQGESPFRRPPPEPDVLDGRHFLDGFWMDDFRGVPSALRSSSSGGVRAEFLHLIDTNTVLVAWGSSRSPGGTRVFFENQIGTALGLEPARQRLSTPTPSLEASPADDEDLASWAGTYLNGGYMVGLRAIAGGLAYYNEVSEIPVEVLRPGVYVARIADGRIGARFQLLEIEGRKFVFLNGTAYARQPG
jgi:CubicO group peptidase (beta-lactamase class C family)